MFESYLGVVLNDGHVDPITGPRCMVRMSEGPGIGRYQVAHTETVLPKGTTVSVDWRRHVAPVPTPV